MRRIGSPWLVISSVLLVAAASADVRPRYGGTLRIEMHAAVSSLDPAGLAKSDSFTSRGLISLLFDTLVTMDESGQVEPALAESWQSSRGNQHWDLRLRKGVKFTDGTVLNAEIAAASLRESNASWNVTASGDMVAIQLDTPDSELPAELALPRNAIAKRDQGLMGTGSFQVAEWQAGKSLALIANEECWRGRPFLDGIEIEMGRSYRDQMTGFDLRKADLVEVAPEQMHHFVQEGRQFMSSGRIELLALVFGRDVASPDEKLLRQALSLSVERGSMRSVLLQGAGEAAGGLLPTPISGYGFVFPTAADLQRARELRNQVRVAPTWTIGYDGNDPLSRLIAERIALNAKDAGLSLRPISAGDADLRVARIPIASSDPWVALGEVLTRIGLASPKNSGGPTDELYAKEQATLADERVIPLFHVPVSYAAAPGLHDWDVRIDGSWNLDKAWLEGSRP